MITTRESFSCSAVSAEKRIENEGISAGPEVGLTYRQFALPFLCRSASFFPRKPRSIDSPLGGLRKITNPPTPINSAIHKGPGSDCGK